MDWVTLIQHIEHIDRALVPLEPDMYNNYSYKNSTQSTLIAQAIISTYISLTFQRFFNLKNRVLNTDIFISN